MIQAASRAVALLASMAALPAAAAPPAGFVADTIGGAFTDVVGATGLPDGRVLAWERSGLVWMIGTDGQRVPTPVLDIRDEVGAWRDFGLLGLALDPNFPSVPDIYLLYVVDRHHLRFAGTPSYDPAANEYFAATIGRITRYSLDPAQGLARTVPSSRRVILGDSASTGLPVCHQSHAVGSLVFGTDGSLLVSMGDSASYESGDTGGQVSGGYITQALADGILTAKEDVGAFRSQLVDSLCGKVLRLDPATGDGMPGNPWFNAAQPRSARSRVWALGLRNPFRMSLVPGTGSHAAADANPGALVVGDVGWGVWEEVSIIDGPGRNLGWPVFEGQDHHPSYAASSTLNQDALDGNCGPLPFRELIRQDTTAPAQPLSRCGVLQAESASASNAPVATSEFGFHGTGYRDFAAVSNAWIEWNVTVPAAGSFPVSFRYANGSGADRPLALLVDGVVRQASVSFPATGSWREWRTASAASIALTAGTHTVRVRPVVSNGPNVDGMWIGAAPSLPASIPSFTHCRPIVEWRHGAADARTAAFGPEGAASFLAVGSASGAAGTPFGGYCAIGGPRLDIPGWPAEFQGAVAFGDYTDGWIRIASTLKQGTCGGTGTSCRCALTVTQVTEFDAGQANLVGLFQDSANGALYAARMSSLARYRWLPGGSQPPRAVIRADRTFGPSPLGVSLDGTGSTDPEGLPLAYQWDFGDGSPPAQGASVFHSYAAPSASPQGYTATLTVRDPGGATSTASVRIGVNSTPPVAMIASIEDGQLYRMDADTTFVLRANVQDAEDPPSALTCRWQTILHHDTHEHPEPPDAACTTSTVITPLGCTPPAQYWYEVTFTATDSAGLTATDRVFLYPDCNGVLGCPGDLNGDGTVGGLDLAGVLSRWGLGGPADLNGDGVVGGQDLSIVLARWGPCGP